MHDTASTALSAFDIAAILVVASALLGWFNHHFLKLPHVIGLTVMGALGAIGLTVADAFIPGVTLDDWVADTLQQLNFTETLLHVTGWLGGYNFQWAWASGVAAGEAL